MCMLREGCLTCVCTVGTGWPTLSDCHMHTHTHTTRAGSCEIDIMEEASTCSPVDMYIQRQLVMLTETVASMVASMVATPMI